MLPSYLCMIPTLAMNNGGVFKAEERVSLPQPRLPN